MKKSILNSIILGISLLTMSFVLLSTTGTGKYEVKNGKVSFYSHTTMEDITAINNKAAATLDGSTGDLVIQVLIKSFVFKKALMQEHFNENYMESTKYPKSTFKGKIDNISAVNFSKNGTYNVKISGSLTIKDKTNTVSTNGTIKVNGKNLNGTTKFKIKLADYNVVVPAAVKDKIAEEMEITADLNFLPKK